MYTNDATPQAVTELEGPQNVEAGNTSSVPETGEQCKLVVSAEAILKRLIAAGNLVLPASSKTKYCDGISWRDFQGPISFKQFEGLSTGLDGVCIVTGNRSGCLEVLDFDAKIEPEQFASILRDFKAQVEAKCPGLFERLAIEETQSGGWHLYFKCPEDEVPGNQKIAHARIEVASSDLSDAGKVMFRGDEYKARQEPDGRYYIYPCLIETRGEGGLVVCAPTPGYELTQGRLDAIPEITLHERDVLLRAARSFEQKIDPRQVITGHERLPEDGTRPGDDYNQRADPLPLLERHGWQVVNGFGSWTRLRRPGKGAGVSASLIAGRTFYPFTTSTEFEPEQGYSPFAVYATLEHGGDFQAAARALAGEGYGADVETKEQAWQDPLPLPDGLPPVPAFDPIMLPDAFKGWLTDIAERTQCPLDYLAAGAMTALSGIVGRKAAVKPKLRDDWVVMPNLWGAVVGPPGVMKTPALSEAIKALKYFEGQAQEQYGEALKRYQEDKQVFQALKPERDKEIKAAHRNGKNPRAVLASYTEPEPPEHKRYLINDTTVEALTEIMQHNPLGVFAFRDELIGLLKMLDKEGQEHARAFYLESWEGRTGFSSDRIGRGHVHVPHACLSLLGGIQPGRLQSYILDAVKGGQGDDGLLQRFQLLVWPDISRKWQDVDRLPDTEAQQRAFNVFEALDQREPEESPFRFDAEALELFREWRNQLEHKIRNGNEHPAFEAHLSKYRSLVPSLALLLALADDPGLQSDIPLEAMEKAAAWAEYLEAHARRVYASVTQTAGLAAESLAKKIKAGAIKDGERVWAIPRKGWARLDTPDAVFDGLYYLEELRWLRVDKEKTGGRPRHIIRLNPTLKKSQPPEK